MQITSSGSHVRNDFSLRFSMKTSVIVIVIVLLIERSHSEDLGYSRVTRVTDSRIELKDMSNVFRFSEDDHKRPLKAIEDGLTPSVLATPNPLFASASTSAPASCHLLNNTAPGVYGSTESGKVVEVPFQYDIVTNKSLLESTHEQIRKNIEMNLSKLLVNALMPSCQGAETNLEKSPELMNRSRIFGHLDGVSCFPADELRSERFDTDDGHLCSPMKGAVSVYFKNENMFDENYEEYEVESTIKRIFEDGSLKSVHSEILETVWFDKPCVDLIETGPGVYGDCKKGTVVEASFQYDIVTNSVPESSYEEIRKSLEMELSYLLSRDLAPSCRNDKGTTNRSRRSNELGGVSCYPADVLESDPFDNIDGYKCLPMKGGVSLYFLNENVSDKEMNVQRTIKKLMEEDQLVHAHPDIVAVEYLARINTNGIIPVTTDVKSETQVFIFSFAEIVVLVSGTIVATLCVGFLVMKWKKRSPQTIENDSKSITFLDGTKFSFGTKLSFRSIVSRNFSFDEATVKRSNKRAYVDEVSDGELSEFDQSTGTFDSMYER